MRRLRAEQLRHAQIAQLHAIVSCEEEVERFDVAMQDVARMQRVQSEQKIDEI